MVVNFVLVELCAHLVSCLLSSDGVSVKVCGPVNELRCLLDLSTLRRLWVRILFRFLHILNWHRLLWKPWLESNSVHKLLSHFGRVVLNRARHIGELISWFRPEHMWVGRFWLARCSFVTFRIDILPVRSVRAKAVIYHVAICWRQMVHSWVSTTFLSTWECSFVHTSCLNHCAFLIEEYWLLFSYVLTWHLLSDVF